MKKLGFSLLVAISVLSFAACSLEPPAMGHLSINVAIAPNAPAPSGSARAISFGPSETPAIRVYVQLNDVFIKSSEGRDYFQSGLSASAGAGSNTVTIDLPPSTGYKVYVALGATNAGSTSDLWATKYFGGTDAFTVAAGVFTPRTVVVASLPATAAYAPSASSAYSAVVGTTLWQLVGTTLSGGSTSIDIAGMGLRVNSLSEGKWFNGAGGFASEPWVNTDRGIYAVRGSSLVQLSSTIGLDAKISGAVVADVNGTGSSLIVFYYGDDVGAAYSSTDSGNGVIDASWQSSSLRTFLASPSGSELKDLIPNPGAFIRAAAFVLDGSSSYGFVSTAIGSYFYSQILQTSMGSDIKGWLKDQIKSSTSQFLVTAPSGGKSMPIGNLALDGSASSPTVYAGTAVGLYKGSFPGGVMTSQALSPVPAAGGINVVKLAAATYNNSSYAAYVDKRGNLVVLQDGNELSGLRFPFYAYTAAEDGATSLTFYQSGNALYLAVASSDGLATLQVSNALAQ